MRVDTRIIEMYKVGHTIPRISRKLGNKYTSKDVAKIIAKNDMTYDSEKFLIIPSVINYKFKI